MTFSYTTSVQNGITVFKLEGEIIDKYQTTGLTDQINQLILSGKKRIVLELVGVRYMNSSGLNVLVNILTKARNAGGDVTVCNLSPKVRELLVVTKLDTIFHILPTVDEAIRKLKAE
jgi:anti-sigma B factor antagonist